MYSSETWRCNGADGKRLNAVETDALRRSSRISRMDRVTNEKIRESMRNRETIKEHVEGKQFVWYGYVRRMPVDQRQLQNGYRRKEGKPGGPKKTWDRGVGEAMSGRDIQEDLWRARKNVERKSGNRTASSDATKPIYIYIYIGVILISMYRRRREW